MSKIENNKKYKRDSLLDSAFTLFIQKGINKTSIQDIAAKSGVAKGTFYLYFKDKYDLRNILIAHKASQLFQAADIAMHKAGITDTIEQMLFIVDHIIDDLAQDKKLLLFISKNLSWGIFKSTLINSSNTENINFYDIYTQLLNQDQYDFIDPEREFVVRDIARHIGNAVPVRLGEIIGQSIIEHLNEHGIEI